MSKFIIISSSISSSSSIHFHVHTSYQLGTVEYWVIAIFLKSSAPLLYSSRSQQPRDLTWRVAILSRMFNLFNLTCRFFLHDSMCDKHYRHDYFYVLSFITIVVLLFKFVLFFCLQIEVSCMTQISVEQ